MFPKPNSTMLALLHRERTPTGKTQHFIFYTKDGLVQRANYVPADDVPASFAGDEIWFEVECTAARPWPRWRGRGPGTPPCF